MKYSLLSALILLFMVAATVRADYPGWRYAGTIDLLTTPQGANLDAASSVADFPVLVRLDKDYFDFRQAMPQGQDIRFSTSTGQPLAYEIDQWDAARGAAAIWVRVPLIQGGACRAIVLHWGNLAAASESSGKAVFNSSSGYLSVWHMNNPVKDVTGTLDSRDAGTTAAAGIIGEARHFAGNEGIFCGDKIPNYPSGSAGHSTECWIRADRSNGTIVAWGNEGGGRGTKVRMQLRSPPHVHVDSDFADVNGQSTLPMSQWIHVVHTYDHGTSKLYINGRLDGAAPVTLGIKSPARLWIGGWYGHYDFVGDIDEVRISNVARSADWVKLEYENQKPMQTLAGPVVQPGDAFSVVPTHATVMENKQVAFVAQAGGARKIYWILKRDGHETVVAVDRFHYAFDAGRISGDAKAVLEFKAIYADGVKRLEIPLTIKEAVPDPLFTLTAPAGWDGRSRIEIVPQVANLPQMQAAGAGEVRYAWTTSDFAVTQKSEPGKLVLTRAQNSGTLSVTATLDNGGKPISQTVRIVVREPKTDPWLMREPAKDETPRDGEFYARDDTDQGTLYYNGVLEQPGDAVFLRVYADGAVVQTERQTLKSDREYRLAVKLKPGLIQYKVEFGATTDGHESVLNTVNNIVCGDAYLIDGQSNAVATEFGKEPYLFRSPWIRSFGSASSSSGAARLDLWGNACARAEGERFQIGYWGMELARRLVADQKIPICIINGAVGGTRIDQHQRNDADPRDAATIYGRLLWRVRAARLSRGIRGVLWHQGENDQGADGPTGGYGYQTYRQYFLEMASAWKQDYPNIQHYYIFQIWPKSCSMGIKGSDNRLREVQRTLPTAFSHMSIMSTLGIQPPGGCHYPPAGYAEIARLICPLVERDNYGTVFSKSITPPDLKRAYYTDGRRDHLVMEFDQPVQWNDNLLGQFYLDGEPGKFAAGSVTGNKVTLILSHRSTAKTLTYLDSKSWSQSTLLRGANGIAALTFCDVPIDNKD